MPGENEIKKTDDKAKQEFEKVPEKKKQPVAIPGDANVYQDVKVYLESIYDFRFNVITQQIEYQNKSEGKWQFMGDREFTLILSNLKLGGAKISKDGLRTILNGQMSVDYHPFHHYILNLPKWDGETDYIEQFSDMVEVWREESREMYRMHWKRWFVAMVASLMDIHVVNHQCFVLLGDQGRFKTTYLNSIVPEHLRLDYLFSQPFDFDNKDHSKYLGTKMLIQLDELSSYNKTDVNQLKTVLTADRIIVRLPYAAFDTQMWRCASFCGNANDDRFLTDETGNRRFLVHKIRGIDYKPFDVSNMYAQAYALWKDGYRYWFTVEEQQELNAWNTQFFNSSIEEELIKQWISKPDERDMDISKVTFMTATSINLFLAEKSTRVNVNESTKQRVGRIMKKLGFERIGKKISALNQTAYGYMVMINEIEYIKNEEKIFSSGF